jgi:hypothetical protein
VEISGGFEIAAKRLLKLAGTAGQLCQFVCETRLT